MNIRQGMFRLWVVISVLFALAVGAFSFSTIREEFRRAGTDYDALARDVGAVAVLPVDCGQARGLPQLPPGATQDKVPAQGDDTGGGIDLSAGLVPKKPSKNQTSAMQTPTPQGWTPPAGAVAVANPNPQSDPYAAYGGKIISPLVESGTPVPPYDFYSNEGYCWYTSEALRRLFPEYKDVNDHDLSDRLYAKAGMPLNHPHPWAKAAEAAGVAFGVPLAILALGYSLLWVFSGFRASESGRNDGGS